MDCPRNLYSNQLLKLISAYGMKTNRITYTVLILFWILAIIGGLVNLFDGSGRVTSMELGGVTLSSVASAPRYMLSGSRQEISLQLHNNTNEIAYYNASDEYISYVVYRKDTREIVTDSSRQPFTTLMPMSQYVAIPPGSHIETDKWIMLYGVPLGWYSIVVSPGTSYNSMEYRYPAEPIEVFFIGSFWAQIFTRSNTIVLSFLLSIISIIWIIPGLILRRRLKIVEQDEGK